MPLYLLIKKIDAALPAFLCLLVSALCACGQGSLNKERPAAVQGVIDLRGWNLARDGTARLDGEWEFCWGRIMETSDFTEPSNRNGCGYIRVPSLWDGQTIHGASIPGRGHATYRLQIRCGPDTGMKTVTIHRIFSAYKIWVNKTLIDERGDMGGTSKKSENFIFIHNKRFSSVGLNEGLNEIIIQVFNHDYESGGIDRSILLDDKETSDLKKSRQQAADLIVFGMLLFAAIYNILFNFSENRMPHRCISVFYVFCLR